MEKFKIKVAMSPGLLKIIYEFIIIILCFLICPFGCFASDYVESTTSHFVFYFHSPDQRLITSLMNQAEVLRKEIVKDLGIDFHERTKVVLASSHREFQAIQFRRNVPHWSIGVAYPGRNLIIIKSPRLYKSKHVDLKKVFKHEFTHILLGRAFKGREKVPLWLDEGLAMYESREWDHSRVFTLTRAVLTDSLISLSEITQRFPREVNKAELAYSESFYLIAFLIDQYGKEGFHQFIKEYSKGKELEKVLMEVYRIRCEELEKRWRSYLKLRFSWIPLATSTTTLWFLIAVIFILGYYKKRKANRLRLEKWEEEENIVHTPVEE